MILFRHWCWSFLGVVIESLPFMVIGAIISTIIQFYISEDIIKRIVPRRRGLAFLVAAFIGLVFPMCECAIVPVARSLIKKGVPIGITITFMLSVPIVNPFVITSTYYAFEANLTIVLIRVVGGILCSIIVGMLITYIFKDSTIESIISDGYLDLSCTCCSSNKKYYISKLDKLITIVCQASNEFLNISVYVILGAFISSIFGSIINEEILNDYTFNNILAVIIMLDISFLLSLCSEADAFVGSKFLNNFGIPAVSAFMILGPMMDLKNAILTLGLFKRKFATILIITILLVVTAFSICLSFISL